MIRILLLMTPLLIVVIEAAKAEETLHQIVVPQYIQRQVVIPQYQQGYWKVDYVSTPKIMPWNWGSNIIRLRRRVVWQPIGPWQYCPPGPQGTLPHRAKGWQPTW